MVKVVSTSDDICIQVSLDEHDVENYTGKGKCPKSIVLFNEEKVSPLYMTRVSDDEKGKVIYSYAPLSYGKRTSKEDLDILRHYLTLNNIKESSI